MVLANFILMCSTLLQPWYRYGVDTTAYINQAGQFWSGQTLYEDITSLQGPCFYPAGHLWHYVPIYIMFKSTDDALKYLKIIHACLHTGIVFVVAKIAFKYFKNAPQKAQISVFMMLCNQQARKTNQELFNDSFLMLYLVLCLYFIMSNRYKLAALTATLSLSIKAGALLVLPVVLGWTQYHHGTLATFVSVSIIFGF